MLGTALLVLAFYPNGNTSDVMNKMDIIYFSITMYLTMMYKQRKNNAAMMNIITIPLAPIMK